MDRPLFATILLFFVLQLISFEVKGNTNDIGFSKDFIEEAKKLGIDIKQNDQQAPSSSTSKKEGSSSPTTEVKKAPETAKSPSPATEVKKTPEVPKSSTTKPSVKKTLKPHHQIKQKTKPGQKNVARHTANKKKVLSKIEDKYFAAPERNINNKDFDEKSYYKRKVYSHDEMPPKFLVEQQNKGKQTNLPKFMMQDELSRLLFIAVNEENIGAIKSLLQKGADINAQDKNNKYTPLMYAVKNNKIDSLRYLLIKGASPNVKAANQMSPLHLAAILNRLKILKILLESGTDIFAKDKYYKTFYDYVSEDYLNIVINDIYDTRKNTNEALLDFCVLGSLNGVAYSLQNKADINAKDQNGDTPLILGVRYRHNKLVTYLLSMGADTTIKNKYNSDAATIARLNNYDKIYKIIETVKFSKQLYILGLVDDTIPYKSIPYKLHKLRK